MTQLIRSDPKQGGTGSVYAINGFFRQPVSPGDYPTWQFITGGPDKQAQLDPEGFDFFMRNTVEVNHINLSLMHNVGQTRALSEISEQIDSIPSSGGSVDAEKIVDEIAERLAE